MLGRRSPGGLGGWGLGFHLQRCSHSKFLVQQVVVYAARHLAVYHAQLPIGDKAESRGSQMPAVYNICMDGC